MKQKSTKRVPTLRITTEPSKGTQVVILDQVNRSHQTKATNLNRKRDHPRGKVSTLVTIDTGSDINITHDKSLLLDSVEFKSPLTTYFGVGSEEHQTPIKLIGQKYFPLIPLLRQLVYQHSFAQMKILRLFQYYSLTAR